MQGRKPNLIGQRFGMIVVVSEGKRQHGRVSWLCRCDCGNEIDVIT